MALNSYRELSVWQRGMDLAVACYRLTQAFPREELFGLTSQIRRSAAAIPANIAEGYGRGHRAEYVQFLRIAQGSLNELETHVTLASKVELLHNDAAGPVLAQCDELGKMLASLLRSLQRESGATP
ncbi:MAG: four helix bundle protein [Armatimonadota bacterium]